LNTVRWNLVIACLLGGWLLLVAVTSAIAQQNVGTITRLSGTAQLLRSGATREAVASMAVELHDQLTTAAASELVLTLSDASVVTLGDSTTLVIDQNVVSGGVRQRTQLNLLAGAVRSLVRIALTGAAPNFEIHTPNAIAGVRGTDFVTQYSEGAERPAYEGCQRYTDVVVYEGTVSVANVANPAAEVTLSAGFETTVPCLLSPLTGGPIGITGVPKGAGGGGRSASVLSNAASGVGFTAPPAGAGSAPPPAPAMKVEQ
jgi:hypothetical protein